MSIAIIGLVLFAWLYIGIICFFEIWGEGRVAWNWFC